MMGTLATALASRKIPTHTDRYKALVEGDIENIDGVLRIARIRVDYDLKVPAGKTGRGAGGLRHLPQEVPGGHECHRLHRHHRQPADHGTGRPLAALAAALASAR